ncbi:hypothetical protein CRYUN_Cryun28dG0066400 [Craigia yunnanensis]
MTSAHLDDESRPFFGFTLRQTNEVGLPVRPDHGMAKSPRQMRKTSLNNLSMHSHPRMGTKSNSKEAWFKKWSHYEQYLEEKSRAEKEEVFLFYSPPWLSSFEKTLLWVGGFKPFLLFKLLANSVTELTPEQEETIERVKYENRREERELTEAMATIQESVAIPPLLNLARRFGRLNDGEALELESAMETLKGRMLRTLERADKLRGSTARKVIEILSPVQTVKFLAASAEFQLKVRNWGLQKDQQRATGLG